MNGFAVQLQGATQYERLEGVVSFVGEDDSGSFGLLAGHAPLITVLVFGLARLRHGDGRWEYLALPGAVLCFEDNLLSLSARRYLRSEDYTAISQALRDELVREEQALAGFRHSLEQLERAMMLRLWRSGRGEEIRP